MAPSGLISYFIGISVMVGKSILDLLYSSGIKGARGLVMALLGYSSETVLTCKRQTHT